MPDDQFTHTNSLQNKSINNQSTKRLYQYLDNARKDDVCVNTTLQSDNKYAPF